MTRTISPKHEYFDSAYYERQDRFALSEKYKKELDLAAGLLKLGAKDTVLDIGCNTGNAARYFIDNFGCRVVGIDYPEAWLGTCKLRASLRVDGYHLSFRDNAFDKVYMFHVLGHVKFPEIILKEACRVLKPGGLCCMVNPNRYFVYLMKPLNYAGIIKYNPDKTVLRYFSTADMARMVRNAGIFLEKNMTVGSLPPYLSKLDGIKLFDGSRERIFTLARK